MLLSAICIGICYSAYGIIGSYFAAFQQKNNKADDLVVLRQILTKDFLKADLVTSANDGVLLHQDSLTVYYSFQLAQILRRQGELRTDTFKLAWEDQYVGFENLELVNSDTIDLFKFKVKLDSVTTVPLIFTKHYGAKDLFH